MHINFQGSHQKKRIKEGSAYISQYSSRFAAINLVHFYNFVSSLSSTLPMHMHGHDELLKERMRIISN